MRLQNSIALRTDLERKEKKRLSILKKDGMSKTTGTSSLSHESKSSSSSYSRLMRTHQVKRHDSFPCVVLAAPGMLQSGLSRHLFDKWASDGNNGVVITGYCVEGTFGFDILREPTEITTLGGVRVARQIEIKEVSFSAHSDYPQTRDFLTKLMPRHVVLVHGRKKR
ncbi:hypothetical protein ADUPG1_010679, partial [Aduncisulcus paluster]